MRKTAVPHRNRSPHGWWIGSYVERFEFHDEDCHNPNRRCLAYENTVLLKARSREEAYRKLIALGSVASSESWHAATGRRGVWRFEGPTQLLPVYEELGDGAEILWTVHPNRSVKSIQALVRTKEQLSVFNDSEEPENA